MTEKEIKAIDEELSIVWGKDSKMYRFCKNEISNIFMFEDDTFITFPKRKINTRFCFGYYDSSENNDSYDNANKMVNIAKTKQDYFISENLEEINKTIEDYKKNDIYIIGEKYTGGKKEVYLLTEKNMFYHFDKKENYKKLTEKEKEEIIKILEIEKEKHIKKINSYLKRYGLSKVVSWSFWADE